jgi:hypothetical protein
MISNKYCLSRKIKLRALLAIEKPSIGNDDELNDFFGCLSSSLKPVIKYLNEDELS